MSTGTTRLVFLISLLLLVAGLGGTVPAPQDVFGLEFTLYQNDTVSETHITLTEEEPVTAPQQSDGPYRFTARDQSGSLVYLMDVDFSFIRASDPGGPRLQDSVPVTVRIPYSPDVTQIELVHDGDVIHTFDTATYLCPPPVDRDIYQTYCDSVNTSLIGTLLSSPFKIAGAVIGLLFLGGLTVYGYRTYQARQERTRKPRRRRNRQIQNSRDRRRR